ncbi:MAG: hypothetical protein R2716_07465 [Microthrixaceae bacterium]
MLAWIPYPLTVVAIVVSIVAPTAAAVALELRTPARSGPGRIVEPLAVALDAVVESMAGALQNARATSPGRSPDAGRQPRPGPGGDREERRGSPEQLVAGAPLRPSAPVLVLTSGPGGAPATRLGGLGSDRDLAGVLFAAYVASGGDEASRVTGWISPCGNPPSVPDLGSGDRLRGRITKILELVACRDDGENWIMLDPRTDVGLAIERREPTDPVLAGLVDWWRLATRDSHVVGPGEVARMADAIDWVSPALGGHPYAALAGRVSDCARTAAAEGLQLSVRVVSSAEAGAPDALAGRGEVSGSGADPATAV